MLACRPRSTTGFCRATETLETRFPAKNRLRYAYTQSDIIALYVAGVAAAAGQDASNFSGTARRFIESSLRLNVARVIVSYIRPTNVNLREPMLRVSTNRLDRSVNSLEEFSFLSCLVGNNSIHDSIHSPFVSNFPHDCTISRGRLNPPMMDDIVARLLHRKLDEWLNSRFLRLFAIDSRKGRGSEVHINVVISMPELIYIQSNNKSRVSNFVEETRERFLIIALENASNVIAFSVICACTTHAFYRSFLY